MRVKKSLLFNIMIMIAILSKCVESKNLCEVYHFDPLNCFQNTPNIKCQYDYSTHKCIKTQHLNLGCSEKLNREACLNQLTDYQNNRVYCFFKQKCKEIKEVHLQQLGCSENLNKYACLSVQNFTCSWNSQRCQQLQQARENNYKLCNIFQMPVNPYTCSQLPSGLCMSSGFEGNFQCIELRFDQLSKLSCYEIGLNEEGCLALNKENQYCIFKNMKCQEIKLSDIKSCDQKLSKSACLSLNHLQCQWVNNECKKFEYDSEQNCLTKNQVNAFVCQSSTGFCQYNEQKQKCTIIDKNQFVFIKCHTPGLSKLGCLSVKNQSCSFINGKCQELSELDLSMYYCNMDHNKQACVNIKTDFQYCFWNGINCERKVINQDYDCPLKLESKEIRVNGNVCQAISKYQKKCKYNPFTNLCIESSIMDECTTPYINKFGCLSITKNDEACHWTVQGCQYIQVIQYITTCDSLGSANPIACSQVFEINEKVGCYFDNLSQQCNSLKTEADPYANKQELIKYLQDQDLLRKFICNDIGFGFNKIVCSSIKTQNVACRWHRDQCVQILNKKDLQTISCLLLKYANYKACSYVIYGEEVCRYSQLQKGCINSIAKNMQCSELGLNSFGCSKAEGSCQFIDDQCQYSDGSYSTTVPQGPSQPVGTVDEPPPDPSQTCELQSPTKAVCLAYSSVTLICQWNKAKGSCETVEPKFNTYCLQYSGIDVAINSNTCASILCDFPDYDPIKGAQVDKNRGYCYYNKSTAQCQIKKEFCNTKCCTEVENQGMNAHSCIKFSSNEPGDYCYFQDFKCQELTDDKVDISNLDQIKLYFNENKLPCSHVNRNSCHMIDWSKEQLCYYNGIVCLNFNLSYYDDKDKRIFTQEPSVLNQNACFAIEGVLSQKNTLKYVGYDDINHRCLEIILDPDFSYAKCEDAKGNRNVCQRYTGNNYCKWDRTQLKCITIPLDEYDEILTCDYELNIKACTDIKKSSCQFSYQMDQCIKVTDFDVDCNHFESLGKVSSQVCLQIIKFGQQCEFRNYQCINSTKISETCDGSLANNRSCFKNTKGLCRWDPKTFLCYVNHQDISQLSCEDYVNIELCKQITKDACIWNDLSNQCEKFNPMNSADFDILDSTGNHKYNQKACLLITGDAYYYNTTTQKCTKFSSKTFDCNTYQLNKFACLYHTRGHHCYYDEQEVIPNQICKPFIFEQTICQTQYQINLDVCMDIQTHCVFDLNTLSCTPFEFQDTMTCSNLLNFSTNQQHPNKRICASVLQTQEQSIAEQQCFEDKLNQQQCLFEKYCFWSDYVCKHFKVVYDSKQSASVQKQTLKVCPPPFEEIDTCEEKIVKNTTGEYRKERKSSIDSSWKWANETHLQHIMTFQREHQYFQISDNLKVCSIIDCTIIEEYYEDVEQITETISPFNEATQQLSENTFIQIEANNFEDTCLNIDCSQLSEYMCTITKDDCLKKKTCQMELDSPYDSAFEGNCLPEKNYISSSWCQLNENKVNICSNHFSKAICLELGKDCYFDINQGGCKQVLDNEHKFVDCNQIANDCYISSSQKAICQNGESSIKPGIKCQTAQKPYKTCVSLTTSSSYLCSDILSTDAQPILCSKANNDCRYDGITCINSMPTKRSDGKYPCDKSFSKSLCIKCGCDYDYLGYCQITKQVPQVDSDQSNKYYLCYEVNLLNTTFKQEICGKVSQACAYVDNKCVDATHFQCSNLLLYTVSLKACQKCQEYATKYVPNEQKCYKIDNNIETSCDNLNQYACLRNTKGVKCKWENFNCQSVIISNSDKIECSILNFDSCYTKQMNNCWIDQTTSLCVYYDPYKGKCDLLKTESLCVRSMYENCKWSSNKCIQNSIIPQNTCDNLNQYLCLNAINIACGWSDLYEKCYKLKFKSQPSSCIDFLESDQQLFINRCNSYTCTQIQVQQGCIHDSYYKCRLIIPLDVISCEVSSVSNINEFACAKLAQGKCKFFNSVCEKTIENNLGCQPYLNYEACLYQNAACKFDIYCQPYTITSEEQIRTTFAYTSSVCKSANLTKKSIDGNVDIGVSLIYGPGKQQCLDITNKTITFNTCNYIGMNKYSCLLKTNYFCEYKENECRFVDFQAFYKLTTCSETLNQYACTRLNVECKFFQNKCVPVKPTDNCQVLQEEKSIVNFRSCLKDSETPCLFDDTTQNCKVITEPQNCKGLNYKGCIFATQGYNCEFTKSKCITSFGSPNCVDDINQEKCLSIISKGQYCYFDQKRGCQNIDLSAIDLNKCSKDGLQTNPYICSQSIDVPCFFDKQSKQCVLFTEKTSSSYALNYSLSNIYSFNKMTCQIFNDLKALMWQESCQILKSSQLVYLKCTALLNKIACLSIKTPFQYCQYKDNKCQNANLDDFSQTPCNEIKDINSGAFCSINKLMQACQYNKSLFRCEQLGTEITTISCVEKDPEEKGLNKTACELDRKNCIYDEDCFRQNFSGNQFCRDINGVSQFKCKQVTGEGCMIQNNICQKIYKKNYNEIKCEQASNRHGCVKIQTQDQYCQYDGEECKQQNVKSFQEIGCLSIMNINHYSFCEQAKDIACTFDLKNGVCRNVYLQEQFSCERGLNRIACLNRTAKQFMCQFLDYCYGPNNGILQCPHNDNDKCCREAGQIDTCLNQRIYNCEWTENGCQGYKKNIDQCDQIINASFMICASIKNVLCVYVPSEHNCQTQIPTTCGLSQSNQQCKRMTSVSCVWDSQDELCIYSENSSYFTCQQVSEKSGNQRTCMNVETYNQFCIYKDEICALYIQQENVNNCLDSINKTACLHQTISDCQWVEQIYKVKKYQYSDEQDVLQGECKPILDIHQIFCSSKISYTACLKISKKGEFCIWKNNQCQSLNQNELYTPNQLIFVNQNACGLVNNGDKVKYNQELKRCEIIDNKQEITCNPEILGINKEACFSIKTQPCIWDSIQKRCQYQIILDGGGNCNKPDWNNLSCSKLDFDQPCGYSINGCQFVDVNSITCTYEGLNKFACLNIKRYPCIWKYNEQTNTHYCDDYTPYTSCSQVPNNVNSKVCQLVDEDACYYDINNQKCKNIDQKMENCDVLGINIKGCIQIDGCVFQESCKTVDKKNYPCQEYPIANYKVCMNAEDSCKFNELTYGCTQSFEEQCDTKGLSLNSCLINKCVWKNNQCQCNNDNFNSKDCIQISDAIKCDSLDHCTYIKEQNLCRYKQCEDLSYNDCEVQYINQSYCYQNTSQQCKSAKGCEDISNPVSKQLNLDNKLCIFNSDLQVYQNLNCEILNEQNCLNYPNNCKFQQSCRFLQCNDHNYNNCPQKICHWNSKSNICEELQECSQFQDEDTCRQMKFENRQCQWITKNDQSFCTNSPCRFQQKQCSGVQISDEICVQIKEDFCLPCEQIQSPCLCLQNNQYCDYDFHYQLCKSKVCSLYTQKDECPQQHCNFNQNCSPQCENIVNKTQCSEDKSCEWLEEQCQKKIKPKDENPKVGLIWASINSLALYILLFYL